MNVKNFFSFGKKKNADGIKVEKINKSKPMNVGEMAAGNLTDASQSIAMMMGNQYKPIKILAVQDGTHSQVLTDYAVKMAHKLDCEIIALDVSEEPLRFDGERRKRETSRFFDRAKRGAEMITLKAESLGVKCKHVAEVGNQEEIIKALSRGDKCIRYVLTKPEQEQLRDQKRKARVQVFDLKASRL